MSDLEAVILVSNLCETRAGQSSIRNCGPPQSVIRYSKCGTESRSRPLLAVKTQLQFSWDSLQQGFLAQRTTVSTSPLDHLITSTGSAVTHSLQQDFAVFGVQAKAPVQLDRSQIRLCVGTRPANQVARKQITVKALDRMAPNTLAGPGEVLSEAGKIIQEAATTGRGLPTLVVFDLDYTLWPFYCECLSRKQMPYLYPQAMDIIHALDAAQVPMAVASRTIAPEIATPFLAKLGIIDTFGVKEIYPTHTHKIKHFDAIHKKTKVPYSEMLFFDDEDRNTKAVSNLGVTAFLVDDDGVCLKSFREGLLAYALGKKLTSL